MTCARTRSQLTATHNKKNTVASAVIHVPDPELLYSISLKVFCVCVSGVMGREFSTDPVLLHYLPPPPIKSQNPAGCGAGKGGDSEFVLQ